VRPKRAANMTNGTAAAKEIRPAHSFKRDGIAAADGRDEIGSCMAIRYPAARAVATPGP
jgi:hypothetical protein